MRSRVGWPAIALSLVLAAACSSGPTAGPPSTLPETSGPSTSTAPATTEPVETTTTEVAEGADLEIVGEEFHIGGSVVNPGGIAEGLLLNSRMVQGVIDITGEVEPFAYPDTGEWDPERNVAEFIAALATYSAAGLNAVTVNLQGGNPLEAPVDNRPPWSISAYTTEGDLDPAWMDRLDRVLHAGAEHDMAVILGLFYFGQDHRLADETAVVRAVDNVVDWLMAGAYDNVLVEICNECNVHYDHAVLQPDRVTELMERVRQRSQDTLAVSASLTGGNVPRNDWIKASDYILLHGNRQEAADIVSMVDRLRASPAFIADPKPIVFNEDSTNLDNMEAAVAAGAGWGYHDKPGFQVPPVDWRIDTDTKRAFFEAVAGLTG